MNESNQKPHQAPMVPVVHDAAYLLRETNRAPLLAAGEYVYPYDLARAIANALMNLNPHDTNLNERLRHSRVKLAHCDAIVEKIKSGEFEAFDSDGVATANDGLETVIRHSDAVKYAANIGVIFKDMAAIDTAPEQAHPAPTVEAVTPAPVVAETPKQRRARWLDLYGEGERGAVQRVYERELLTNPKADRSNIGKEIEKAKQEKKEAKQGGLMFSQLVQDRKRVN